MVRYSLFASLAIGVTFGMLGCNPNAGYQKVSEVKKAPPAEEGHDHDHSEKGPHGGGIVEIGEEEYHAEIVLDHDKHSLAVYVLGKDAKTPEPVAAKETTLTPEDKEPLTLKAAPQPGDAEGKTTKFELIDEKVVDDLSSAGFLHGTLKIKIGDKDYESHIDYHMDGSKHEDHDHADKKPEGEEKKPAEGEGKPVEGDAKPAEGEKK